MVSLKNFYTQYNFLCYVRLDLTLHFYRRTRKLCSALPKKLALSPALFPCGRCHSRLRALSHQDHSFSMALAISPRLVTIFDDVDGEGDGNELYRPMLSPPPSDAYCVNHNETISVCVIPPHDGTGLPNAKVINATVTEKLIDWDYDSSSENKECVDADAAGVYIVTTIIFLMHHFFKIGHSKNIFKRIRKCLNFASPRSFKLINFIPFTHRPRLIEYKIRRMLSNRHDSDRVRGEFYHFCDIDDAKW